MTQTFGETVSCETCGEKHTYDQLMGYDCLVLIDGRYCPNSLWAWCNEVCLNQWLDSPNAKELFATQQKGDESDK